MSTSESKTKLKTLVILPAYNLEAGVGEIVRKCAPYVDQVMVVADGSNDATAERAREAGAHVPEPELTRGKGFAVIKGFEASKAFAPDIIVLMDADGQHLPEELPVVCAPLVAEECDMVIGSRMLGSLKTSRINVFGNWVLKIISFCVTWKWITDTETGFRAFKAAKLYTLELSSPGYEIESELFLKALHAKFSYREVPIHVPFAVPGVTVWDGLKVAWYKLRLGTLLRLGMV